MRFYIVFCAAIATLRLAAFAGATPAPPATAKFAGEAKTAPIAKLPDGVFEDSNTVKGASGRSDAKRSLRAVGDLQPVRLDVDDAPPPAVVASKLVNATSFVAVRRQVPVAEPRICEPGGGGNFVPFIPGESNMSPTSRGCLYLGILLWSFLGVAIIADVFMSAIEQITSKKTRVQLPGGQWRTVKVWNATVANLTLMALGSSAPEIMLSVIELADRKFYSGELGPSTIVGSAAYNLLIIIAVSIWAIPGGEIRKIKELGVYTVTASCSIFAYLWLIFILMVNSPDVVEVWEGVLTFIFFPILVVVAYLVDKGYIPLMKSTSAEGTVVSGDLSHEEIMMIAEKIKHNHGDHLPASTLAHLAHADAQLSSHGVRGEHKRSAVGWLKGGKVKGAGAPPVEERAAVGFSFPFTIASWKDSTVSIPVKRTGSAKETLKVKYTLVDGTAQAGVQFVAEKGDQLLTITPGETEAEIRVPLKPGSVGEGGSRHFAAKLVSATAEEAPSFWSSRTTKAPAMPRSFSITGDQAVCAVNIVDDREPGKFKFESESMVVPECSFDREVKVKVLRTTGTSGVVSCEYFAEDGSAISGNDYELEKGTLVFKDGQKAAEITLTIKANKMYERSEDFRVLIANATGGASFDKSTDGGESQCILTISIKVDEEVKRAAQMLSTMAVDWDRAEASEEAWKQQFVEAIYCNGSAEDQAEANVVDWVLHILSLPFKLTYALVPPPLFMDGWVCFFVSLGFVAITTMLIGEVASMVGCCFGIADAITAITFVALGTSLPDTFASQTAATSDPFADAALGNVTGSNSVNVFLGLGLPWMVGAIFWASKGADDEWRGRIRPDIVAAYPEGTFVVEAGDLGFSVSVFTACALVCIIILALRRRLYGGELGGPKGPKVVSCVVLVGLWIAYIALSIFKITSSTA